MKTKMFIAAGFAAARLLGAAELTERKILTLDGAHAPSRRRWRRHRRTKPAV